MRGDQIDGTLQVGVARSSLRWIAVVGARVFDLPERDGYVWTTTHLHGPVQHPAEDLTPAADRGGAAGGDRQGEAGGEHGAGYGEQIARFVEEMRGRSNLRRFTAFLSIYLVS